jgi:hypothetical protein
LNAFHLDASGSMGKDMNGQADGSRKSAITIVKDPRMPMSVFMYGQEGSE